MTEKLCDVPKATQLVSCKEGIQTSICLQPSLIRSIIKPLLPHPSKPKQVLFLSLPSTSLLWKDQKSPKCYYETLQLSFLKSNTTCNIELVSAHGCFKKKCYKVLSATNQNTPLSVAISLISRPSRARVHCYKCLLSVVLL